MHVYWYYQRVFQRSTREHLQSKRIPVGREDSKVLRESQYIRICRYYYVQIIFPHETFLLSFRGVLFPYLQKVRNMNTLFCDCCGDIVNAVYPCKFVFHDGLTTNLDICPDCMNHGTLEINLKRKRLVTLLLLRRKSIRS